MKRFTLGATARLKHRSHIKTVFSKEAFVTSYGPLRAHGILLPERIDAPVKIGVAAPKRLFKKAVDRNYVKRLLREAYRLNQESLNVNVGADQTLLVMVFYTRKELPKFTAVDEATQGLLERLRNKLA